MQKWSVLQARDGMNLRNTDISFFSTRISFSFFYCSFSTCIDKKKYVEQFFRLIHRNFTNSSFSVEHFSRRPLFRFLTQPDVVSAINSITADNIIDYYQQERPNSDLSQVYHGIANDLEEVLESNFFKESTTRVLKDIRDTWAVSKLFYILCIGG